MRYVSRARLTTCGCCITLDSNRNSDTHVPSARFVSSSRRNGRVANLLEAPRDIPGAMQLVFRCAFFTALSTVDAYAVGAYASVNTRSTASRVSLPCMKVDTGGAAIVCKEVDVWAGNSPLILDVNWDIMPKSRWAIQGTNGCGKSTLLRAIAASAKGDKLEEGLILVDSTLRMGMLEQTAVSGSDNTVREEVVSRMARFQAATKALNAAVENCVLGSEEELACLEKAQEEFEACGGYDIEARVSKVLQGLGFKPEEFDSKCSSFSGGWQMRIGLARLLLSEPELLIMDEPTNHLDAAARRWLAEYISAYSGTVLVVSHDEAFVSVACNSIADVDGGRLCLYPSTPLSRSPLHDRV